MFDMYYSPRLLWLPALIIFSWFLALGDASADPATRFFLNAPSLN